MSNEDIELNILQQKLNALVAKYMHEKHIRKFRSLNLWVEYLSIAVPIFYAAPRYIVKGTAIAPFFEYIGEFLGAILLTLAILKLVFGWQQSEIKHSVMLRKNAEISDEAQRLLERKITSREVIEQFSRRVRDVDNEDSELLPNPPRKEKQEAYREALKLVIPGKTMRCQICDANPWHYQPGNCRACGGNGNQSTAERRK